MSKELVKKSDLSDLGKALVKKAKENIRQEDQDQYQKFFDDILRKISESERTLRIGEAALAHFKAQKKALEDGEFHFHLFRKTVIFNEDKLNKNYQEL